MKAADEITMQHFNAHARCRRSKTALPQVNYEPGCCWVECCAVGHCACRMVDGEGLPLAKFLEQWQRRHGA